MTTIEGTPMPNPGGDMPLPMPLPNEESNSIQHFLWTIYMTLKKKTQISFAKWRKGKERKQRMRVWMKTKEQRWGLLQLV